jgi:hypothetical protein
VFIVKDNKKAVSPFLRRPFSSAFTAFGWLKDKPQTQLCLPAAPQIWAGYKGFFE